MTDTKTEQPAASKTPSHIAYQVREGKEKASFWTRVGAAWAHNDGKGFNVSLDALPLDGRIVLRVVAEKND